jgi:hypothetical protein
VYRAASTIDPAYDVRKIPHTPTVRVAFGVLAVAPDEKLPRVARFIFDAAASSEPTEQGQHLFTIVDALAAYRNFRPKLYLVLTMNARV